MKDDYAESLENTFGVQNVEDKSWSRPVVFGDNLFSQVIYIPPGVKIEKFPQAEEEQQLEQTLYILSGSLLVTTKGDQTRQVDHSALQIPPGESVGISNDSNDLVSILVVHTPSPWGAHSPIESHQSVESLDRLLEWMVQNGEKVRSPHDLNAIARKLRNPTRDLSDLKANFQMAQGAGGGESKTGIALWDALGYQHWHKPHPPDEFWFRPLICGDNHLSYVGLVPPSGSVPPSPEEAGFVEMCIYTLAGDLGCIILEGEEEKRFTLPPHHALYAARFLPLGFFNDGEETASFLLTFTPNRPGRNTVAIFHDLAVNEYGWKQFSAEDLNEMHGDTLWK